MSEVAHCAYALVPPESNFEGLTKRLLALRAEIDAILAALASQAMAMPHSTAARTAEPALALSPPAEEPTAAVEQDLLQIPSDTPADGAMKFEGYAMVEETEVALEPSADENGTGELLEPSEMVAAAAPEQPAADTTELEPIEVEQDASDWAAPASDDRMPTAAIDADAAEHTEDGSLFTEAGVAPTEIAATEAVSADEHGDAAMLDGPQASSQEHPLQPAAQVDGAFSRADVAPAGGSPAKPATEAEEALADAAVISLHPRQRKHKGELPIGAPMQARSGRYLIAKIAACILMLLTAATVLVMADRTALGSVPSMPWMSQTPAVPTGIEWLLQRIKESAAQATGKAATAADLPLDDGPASSAWGA